MRKKYFFLLLTIFFIPLFAHFQLSKTVQTQSKHIAKKQFSFDVGSRRGDRDVFNFEVNQTGIITAEASWSGDAPQLTLLLNGPTRQEFVRKNGKSPLKISFQVTEQIIKKGKKWKLSIINFSRRGTARGSIKASFPSSTVGLAFYYDKEDIKIEVPEADIKRFRIPSSGEEQYKLRVGAKGSMPSGLFTGEYNVFNFKTPQIGNGTLKMEWSPSNVQFDILIFPPGESSGGQIESGRYNPQGTPIRRVTLASPFIYQFNITDENLHQGEVWNVVYFNQSNTPVNDGTATITFPIPHSDVVFTVAGNGKPGLRDDYGKQAQFQKPNDVAVDKNGNIYVADTDNHAIRKILLSGRVVTIAGNGMAGYANGRDRTARFNKPMGIVVDSSGNLYIADSLNHRIRKITPNGIVSTLAGTGTKGFDDGPFNSASFDNPHGIAIGPEGKIYVADRGNDAVRILSLRERRVETFEALSQTTGQKVRNGFPLPNAVFVSSKYIIVGSEAWMIWSDFLGNKSKIGPQVLDTGYKDGCINRDVRFNIIYGIVYDGEKYVYISDSHNHCIRRDDFIESCVSKLSGKVPTGSIVGGGMIDSLIDRAQFYFPAGLAIDKFGSLYVADKYNNRIRMIVLNQ